MPLAPPAPPSRRGLLRRWAIAGAAVGVCDGLFAVALTYIFSPTPSVVRLFQGIAVSVLGRETAFSGGLATAALGFLIHFTVAYSWSAVYLVLWRAWPGLRRAAATWLGGAGAAVAFGAMVWLCMDLIVLP